MTVIAMVPLMGGLAIGIDYTEMTRQRQNALNALDAAGVATAQQIVAGATDADAKAYAKNFFEANLAHIDPANTTLAVTLPNNNTGGGTLKLCSTLTYKPTSCRRQKCCWVAAPPTATSASVHAPKSA